MICAKCTNVTRAFSYPDWNDDIPHHFTFTELDVSAEAGCELCELFRDVLLETCTKETGKPMEEAKLYPDSLESLDENNENSGLESDRLSTCSYATDELVDVKDVTNSGSSFVVSPIRHELDGDFAPLESGIVRVLYCWEESAHYVEYSGAYCTLEIASLVGKNAPCAWEIVGKKVSQSPDLQLARHWIDECLQRHKYCSGLSESQLPSRVLDLKPQAGTLDICLRATSGLRGMYAALSHCWGQSQPIRLTSNNRTQFQTILAFDDLPRMFQDAVTVSRSLGLRYLWIDSLCIIQDSKKDWEEQCAKMAQVYRDAYVTIAGSTASDCHSGLLYDRPMPRQVGLRISDDNDSNDIAVLHHRTKQWYLNSYFTPEQDSPLAKRGWVLQERLLSQRVLYLGNANMYLECFQHVNFENCHYPVIWERVDTDTVVKKSIERLRTRTNCFGYWLEVVSEYSGLQLSNPADKLPALSGIASEIRRLTSARYLAGIWYEDIAKGLAWYVMQSTRGPSSPSTGAYIAPSWSWASAKLSCYYLTYNFSPEIQDGPEILNAEVSLAGLDPFGRVVAGHLQVRGKLRRAIVRSRVVYQGFSVQVDGIPDDELPIYYPDHVLPVDGLEVSLLYLGKSHDGATGMGSVALSVELTGQRPDEYRRVGLAINDPFSTDHLGKLFQGSSSSVLRIV